MTTESKESKINNLVRQFKEESCLENADFIFSELYLEISDRWRKDGVIQSLSFRYRIEESEVLSLALEKLYQVVQAFYDFAYEFYHYLSRSLSNACMKEAKSRKSRKNEEFMSSVSSMEDDPNLVRFIPHANADNEELDDYVKRSEQRQLIAKLTEKADDKSRQALTAFSKSKSGSFLDASKSLGIDDKTVKRRVRKVAKLFDPKQFGDIHDYFTVETERVS